MYKAAECVEGNGKLWWFATPGSDTRCRQVLERVPEEKGTRNRKRTGPRKPPQVAVQTA
jgi:hypothetical protein